MQSLFEKLFKLKENHTDQRTEFMAGMTTFLAMAYILAVNPTILGAAGMPKGGVLIATAASACIGTLLMAFLSNYPFVLAPGMGLNAYFTYSVVIGMGYSWQFSLMAVFIEGIIFLLLTLTKIREAIFDTIPLSLKHAVSVGIGLFITLVAMQSAKIIVDNPATLVGFQSFTKDSFSTSGICAVLALAGVIVIAVMLHFKVRGAILWGMLITWVAGMIAQAVGLYKVNAVAGFYSLYPDFSIGAISENIAEAKQLFGSLFDSSTWTRNGYSVKGDQLLYSFHFITVVFAFLFVDLFDTLGTVIGTASQANMLDKNGHLGRIRGVLLADSLATSVGAIFGTSTTTTYVESAAGITCGGRTGLTALTAALFFLAALLFSPLFLAMPGFATAPALIIVGLYMISNVKKLDFSYFPDAVPAFITIVVMPFAYSISEGIALGMISWTLINVFCGNWKRVSLLMYILTLLFIMKYICL